MQAHCILQDITDQHRAQESLRASEEKYFSYIKNAPDAIIIINREGKIVEVNDTATDITGYAREELLSIAVADFIDPDSQAQGEAAVPEPDHAGIWSAGSWSTGIKAAPCAGRTSAR